MAAGETGSRTRCADHSGDHGQQMSYSCSPSGISQSSAGVAYCANSTAIQPGRYLRSMNVLAVPSYSSVLLHLLRENLETGELQELATATGFLVNSDRGMYLVTNWHAFTGYDPMTAESLGRFAAPPTHVDVDFHNPDDLSDPAVHRYPLYEEGIPLWFVHPGLSHHVDVVALRVSFGGAWAMKPGTTIQSQPYEIKHSRGFQIEPSTDVSVIGFPYGRQSTGSLGIWVRGTVASEPGLDFEGDPVFLIDCRSRRGQSGSPVLAYRPAGSIVQFSDGGSQVRSGPTWQLLGVYSGRISEESDLGKVWRLEVLREILKFRVRDSFEFF